MFYWIKAACSFQQVRHLESLQLFQFHALSVRESLCLFVYVCSAVLAVHTRLLVRGAASLRVAERRL